MIYLIFCFIPVMVIKKDYMTYLLKTKMLLSGHPGYESGPSRKPASPPCLTILWHQEFSPWVFTCDSQKIPWQTYLIPCKEVRPTQNKNREPVDVKLVPVYTPRRSLPRNRSSPGTRMKTEVDTLPTSLLDCQGLGFPHP